jgi:multicomponent K+:H+ antiporter subunit G
MSAPASFAQLLAAALIVLGSGFALIGSWGLVRLPSLMERLHGPTKASTLGMGAMLVASIVWFQLGEGVWTTHELLIALFLFVTAPISANMIAKVHLHRLRSRDASGGVSEPAGPAGPPAPPLGSADWATHQAPHEGAPGDFVGD